MTAEPTLHQLRAAVEVARIVDATGNPTADVRDAYRHLLTGGEHRALSLTAGEQLLLRVGLLIEQEGRLQRAGPIEVLANLGEDEAVEVLRARHVTVIDQELRDEIGAAGEAAVMAACRDGLNELCSPHLAEQVQQVSLVDDTCGYDISAPSITGPARLLEVKTSGRDRPGLFEFYISRNEYSVGRRMPDKWALVACRWEASTASIVGWCRAAALAPYLPTDGAGHWVQALVQLPFTQLVAGIPAPV